MLSMCSKGRCGIALVQRTNMELLRGKITGSSRSLKVVAGRSQVVAGGRKTGRRWSQVATECLASLLKLNHCTLFDCLRVSNNYPNILFFNF